MKCPKITLCNLCQQRKGSYHQGFGLLVVKYGCESWTIKKTEHWGTDGFELWCCRRLLQVPWTVKRSNQSILKEINPEYSLEGLMLKLKSPDANFWIIGKDPDAGKDWRQKEKRVIDDEMVRWHHQFNGHEFGQTLGDGEGQGSLAWGRPWGHKELDTTEQVNSNNVHNPDYTKKTFNGIL